MGEAGRKKNRKAPNKQPSTSMPDYLVQVAGPLGTTREFYDDIRKLMACKRKSWAGLLHPRKVTVYFVHNSIVQEEMPSAGSASSATATGDQEPGDEAADDTDEGEPPCEADLFFMKLQNLPTGRRLETPNEGTQVDHVVQFPCQGPEHNSEAHKNFHRLLDDARDHLQVVSMHDA